LNVKNTIDEPADEIKERSFTGIGLENVKRRLQLIYNNRYTLHINKANNIYSVLLKIKIP